MLGSSVRKHPSFSFRPLRADAVSGKQLSIKSLTQRNASCVGATRRRRIKAFDSKPKSDSRFQPTGSPSRLEGFKTRFYDVINSSASSSQTVSVGVKTELGFPSTRTAQQPSSKASV